eukprot:239425_1
MENISFIKQTVSLEQNKAQILQNLKLLLPKLLKQYPSNTQYKISSNSDFGYGYTNLLFHVQPIGYNEQYLLRIYGESVVNRKRELRYLLELQNCNIGPKVYGVFNNGRIEQYYTDVIVVDPLKGYSKANKIAQAMATFHKVIPQNKNITKTIINQEGVWQLIQEWYSKASSFTVKDFNSNDRYKQYLGLDWKNIKNQLEWLKLLLPSKDIINSKENAMKVMEYHYGKNIKHLIGVNKNFEMEFIARKFLYDRILSHNDVYLGNVLELKKSNQVVLIDFEYTSYNYRGCDFGTMFGRCKRDGFMESDICDSGQRQQFIEWYLMEFEEFKKEKYRKNEWSCLLKKCDSVILEFCMINAYVWGLWAVIQAVFTTLSGVDNINYARQRLYFQYNYFKRLWIQQYKTNIVCLSNSRL